jgi:hypothetical protein
VGLEIFCSFFLGTKQAPGWYDRKRKAINSGDKSPRGGMKKARAPCLQGVAPRRGYCVLGKRPRGAQNKYLARCYTNGARHARGSSIYCGYSCAVARHKISVVVISVPGRHCVIRESPRVPFSSRPICIDRIAKLQLRCRVAPNFGRGLWSPDIVSSEISPAE